MRHDTFHILNLNYHGLIQIHLVNIVIKAAAMLFVYLSEENKILAPIFITLLLNKTFIILTMP